MGIQVVSFNCVLKNKAGKVISSTFNRDVLTSAGTDNSTLPGLSKGLQNLTQGERRTIFLLAEEAYGLYEPKKVVLYPRKKLPRELGIGEYVSIAGEGGFVRSFKVLQFHEGMVSLDGNHPLAGQDLIFEIETLEAREATPEEIADNLETPSSQLLH